MEKRVISAFVATLIVFGAINLAFVNFFGVPFSPVVITGHAIQDSGIVEIFIEENINVYIYSPENITYAFNKGDPYIVALNVAADFAVEPNGWKYSLYDLEHEEFVEEDVLFVPNSSITAVRWGNLLSVYALSDSGQWAMAEVAFYVNVSNSYPILANISDPIYVCEGEALSYETNATDIDEDDLVGDISPKNPFYLSSSGRQGTVSFFEIISGVLDKEDVGVYSEEISAVDPWDGIDSKEFDIEVIEINNAPVLRNIGAQTVWLEGDNSQFNLEVQASDIEDGETEDGDLIFNLSWEGEENLFGIGENDGVMTYSPIVGHEGKVYDLQVCVRDNPLESTHENISLCLPKSNESNVVCDDFTLTVTDENRAPRIINFTPNESILKVSGLSRIDFEVNVRDADGTIPDIDWYVNNRMVEHNENISFDSFSYSFPCGVSGAYSIKIVTTDGLLNDSREWSVALSQTECPVESSSGGGGGGGAYTDFCAEDWFCGDWDVCQNVRRSFESGILSIEDYSVAKAACSQNMEEDERFCGFQVKSCEDLNGCNNLQKIYPRPIERRFCYFTENPSCSDGITNCHDGACEVLVDCGGPCSACPTCSDGIQNQDEEGVDCGGSCPYLCEPEVPFAMLSSVLIVVSVFLVLVIIFILWKLWLLWKRRDDEEEKKSI